MIFTWLFRGNSPNSQLWPQYFTALTAEFCTVCTGLHFGWPSPSVPKLISDDYPFDITEDEASYITIIGPFGDIFGNILSWPMMDVLGRKRSIATIGLLQILSMLMISLSYYTKILLYTGRFVGGVAEGICMSVMMVYVCEISVPKIRGALGNAFFLSLITGMLLVNILGSIYSIYTTAIIAICLNIVFVTIFAFMPESPYYLLMKDKVQDARDSLQKLRQSKNIEHELTELNRDVKRQMEDKGSIRDVFTTPSYRKAFIVMVVLRIMQPYSGFTPFSYYAQTLFKEATDAIPQEYAAILMIAIEIIAAIIAVFIIDKFGRRLLLFSSTAACITMLIIGGVFFIIKDATSIDVSNLSIIPLIVVLLFTISYALGLGSAVNLLAGELFPTSIKAKASGITTVLYSAGGLTSAKFYQYTADNISLAIPFFVFALILIIGFSICWFLLPETKNKTLDEIQLELSGAKKTKRSVEVSVLS